MRSDNHVLVTVCQRNVDQFIAIVQIDSFQTVLPDVFKVFNRRPFDSSFLRREEEVFGLFIIIMRNIDHRCDLFAGIDIQQIDYRNSLR